MDLRPVAHGSRHQRLDRLGDAGLRLRSGMQRRVGRRKVVVQKLAAVHLAVAHEQRGDVNEGNARHRALSVVSSELMVDRLGGAVDVSVSHAGQDAEQDDLRARHAAAGLIDDRLNAGDGLRGVPMHPAHVVGADQDDRDLRMQAVELAVLDAPQQMRGGVALEAEVERVPVGVEPLPSGGEVAPIFRPGLLPILGDAVAKPNQVDAPATGLGKFRLVAGAPPAGFHAADGRRGYGFTRRAVGTGNEHHGSEQSEAAGDHRRDSQTMLPMPKIRQ